MSEVHSQQADSVQDSALQEIREQVLSTCRTLADRGFLAGTGGNVALRADDGHFCVTPSGTDYYTMVPEDICVLRLDDLQQVAGDRKPSVESGLHSLVLKARPDCMASIHTHQPVASACTLFGKPLQVISEAHRQLLGETVPCAGYAPSGTSWLAGKVAKKITANTHAYLMRNHGVVCVGETVETAMARVEALEQACAEFFEQRLAKHENRLSSELVGAVRTLLTSVHAAGDAASC